MREIRPISGRGALALICSLVLIFEPVVAAENREFATPAERAPGDAPVSIAVAKLTGTAERNGQPLLNGSIVASGDALRTHEDSALLLNPGPEERLWLGPNSSVKISKDAGTVVASLGRGSLAFTTRGHIQVAIESHEGMVLRSRPESVVRAQLNLVSNDEAQVRVQEGSLELIQGNRSVRLEPDQPSRRIVARPWRGGTSADTSDGQEQSEDQSTTGTIKGTVVDPDLFVVPDAKVSLASAGGKVLTATSNDQGKFTFTDVPPGVYTLRVAKAKFHTYELKNVMARSGNESTLFVQLAAGPASNNKTLLIWLAVGGAAAAGIGAGLASRGSSHSASPSTVP